MKYAIKILILDPKAREQDVLWYADTGKTPHEIEVAEDLGVADASKRLEYESLVFAKYRAKMLHKQYENLRKMLYADCRVIVGFIIQVVPAEPIDYPVVSAA